MSEQASKLEQPTCQFCGAFLEEDTTCAECIAAEYEPDPDRYHDSLDDSWEPLTARED